MEPLFRKRFSLDPFLDSCYTTEHFVLYLCYAAKHFILEKVRLPCQRISGGCLRRAESMRGDELLLFFITLEPTVELYKSLRPLNTSPLWNRFTICEVVVLKSRTVAMRRGNPRARYAPTRKGLYGVCRVLTSKCMPFSGMRGQALLNRWFQARPHICGRIQRLLRLSTSQGGRTVRSCP